MGEGKEHSFSTFPRFRQPWMKRKLHVEEQMPEAKERRGEGSSRARQWDAHPRASEELQGAGLAPCNMSAQEWADKRCPSPSEVTPPHLSDDAISVLIGLLSYYIHDLHSFWHLEQHSQVTRNTSTKSHKILHSTEMSRVWLENLHNRIVLIASLNPPKESHSNGLYL